MNKRVLSLMVALWLAVSLQADVLSSLRMFDHAEDYPSMIRHANDFFESREDDVLIVHRKDMILVRNSDIADVFDELCALGDRFDAWERQLAELEHKNSCLQEMIDVSDSVIHAPLFLYAPDGAALALSSAYGPDVHFHWAGLIRDGGLTEEGLIFLRDTIDLPTVFLDRKSTRRRGAFVAWLKSLVQ